MLSKLHLPYYLYSGKYIIFRWLKWHGKWESNPSMLILETNASLNLAIAVLKFRGNNRKMYFPRDEVTLYCATLKLLSVF